LFPLSKVKDIIAPGGAVTASLVNVGPDASGSYLRTEAGYWAHPEWKLIGNTQAIPDQREARVPESPSPSPHPCHQSGETGSKAQRSSVECIPA
jgi:hypothetical protein